MTRGRQGEQRGHNMEKLQPPDLAIWRMEKVNFSIITKYKSKNMVLYPLSIRFQRAKEHQNWSSYEEMADVLLRKPVTLTTTDTGRPCLFGCPYHGIQDAKTSEKLAFSSPFRPPLVPRVPPSHKVGIEGVTRALLSLYKEDTFMTKGRQGEQRGHNMEKLQPPNLVIWRM
jgi:hypothetical protein